MVKERGYVVEEPAFVGKVHDVNEVADDVEEMWEIVKENIKYILKRENMWKENYSVSRGAGAYRKVDCEEGYYQFNFTIWRSLEEYETKGIAYGTLDCFMEGGQQKGIINRVRVELKEHLRR